jgi:hypothetical protein
MKFPGHSLLLLATTVSFWTPTTVFSFAPSSLNPHGRCLESQMTLNIFPQDTNSHEGNHHNLESYIKSVEKGVKGALVATCLAGAIWASPAALVGGMMSESGMGNSYNHDPMHISSYLDAIRPSVVAQAKEMASASGSRVNKDPESLLRYGLPIPKDKEVR